MLGVDFLKVFSSTAGYLLTQKDVFFDRTQFCQIVAAMLHSKDIAVRIDLPPPVIWKVKFSPVNCTHQSILLGILLATLSLLLLLCESLVVRVCKRNFLSFTYKDCIKPAREQVYTQ